MNTVVSVIDYAIFKSFGAPVHRLPKFVCRANSRAHVFRVPKSINDYNDNMLLYCIAQ